MQSILDSITSLPYCIPKDYSEKHFQEWLNSGVDSAIATGEIFSGAAKWGASL